MYNLIPFNFTRLSNSEVLVNELGDMIIAPNGTVDAVVNHTLPSNDLYKTLVANHFIYEGIVPPLIDVYALRLRTKKCFLDDFTSLHIFVLTLRCNQNCVYCQASSQNEDSANCSMSKETMDASIKLMFQSPSKKLTVEFQGGEPSIMLDLIRYAITEIERVNETEKRDVTYVLCTNCFNLTDSLLELCQKHNVLISTSIDGPEWLHNQNRGRTDSYQRVVANINKARAVLGFDSVSALQTTSEFGVNYPIETIDEYVNLGFHSIFIRALNPYGMASQNSNWEQYTERFIEFYKKALDYIVEKNKQGEFFVEEFAVIVLRKILTPFATGFVDLQSPAGIINSVLVYNYDGYVYASDESRMLAEAKDYTFRLGKATDDYEKIVCGDTAKQCAKVWANECIAGCSDCALKSYCGADPVRNYSTQGDMYGFRPTSLLCKKNKAIIEYIISMIIDRGDEVLPIFRSWLL